VLPKNHLSPISLGLLTVDQFSRFTEQLLGYCPHLLPLDEGAVFHFSARMVAFASTRGTNTTTIKSHEKDGLLHSSANILDIFGLTSIVARRTYTMSAKYSLFQSSSGSKSTSFSIVATSPTFKKPDLLKFFRKQRMKGRAI
jgi:hypothetical protein